jgi:ribulose-bisphosphate carboxylase large chain
VEFPSSLIKSFKGPLYGIDGIRKLLNVPKRPLVGTIVKPKIGLNEKEHAKVAYDAWVGGIDIVKDDENLSNQKFNNFSKRIVETLKMRDMAEKETGERKVYMPNITSESDTMLKRANFVKEASGRYLMVDIISVGWSALQTVRNANDDLKLVLHAHRAGHGAFTKDPKHGISMRVVSKLTRIVGMDQLHVGTVVGKMFETKEEVLQNCDALRGKMNGLKTAMPVSSGGLHACLVPSLVKIFGNDFIIQAGGGIHGHPGGTVAGAKSMRQALDASMSNTDLKAYAKSHKELKQALEKWG